MSPSWNQRRAMPVVTMMTFQRRRLGRRLALAVDHADAQVRRAEDLLGDRADGERLARARAGDDAEALRRARASSRTRAPCCCSRNVSMCRPTRELDRLARGARRRDDDDAPGRRLGRDERVVVGREVLVSVRRACAAARGEKRARAAAAALRASFRSSPNLLEERRIASCLAASGRCPCVLVVVTEDHLAVRRAVADRRRAVRGRGCCLAGTLSSQIRHMPGGGRYAFGTSSSPAAAGRARRRPGRPSRRA